MAIKQAPSSRSSSLSSKHYSSSNPSSLAGYPPSKLRSSAIFLGYWKTPLKVMLCRLRASSACTRHECWCYPICMLSRRHYSRETKTKTKCYQHSKIWIKIRSLLPNLLTESSITINSCWACTKLAKSIDSQSCLITAPKCYEKFWRSSPRIVRAIWQII